MVHNAIQSRIDRMAEIKRQQEALKTEWAELEAYFLKVGGNDLADTKRKSVAYTGENGKVTCTIAEKVSVAYASHLKRIFGDSYDDCVTADIKYRLSAPAARMLGGLWSKNYSRMTLAEAVEQLPVDAVAKKTLAKKLRGINYDKDKENLVSIGGFKEEDAADYAYLIYEAAIWENFLRLMKVNQIEDTAAMDEIIGLIDGAVVVEETPKISLELFDE